MRGSVMYSAVMYSDLQYSDLKCTDIQFSGVKFSTMMRVIDEQCDVYSVVINCVVVYSPVMKDSMVFSGILWWVVKAIKIPTKHTETTSTVL